MPYQPIPVKGWRGVNYADDPSDVGLDQFVDGYNMEVVEGGRLRPRTGSAQWASLGAITVMRRLGDYVFFSLLNGTSSTTYRTILSTGATGSLAAGATTDWSADLAACGVSGTVYSCNTGRTLRSVPLTVGPLSAPIAGTPVCSILATKPLSDRLVAAGQSDPSKLSFSAPGDGTTWGATDSIDLTPGDGGAINSIATYGNELFVFKPDKFFVFGPESTDSVGGAVFNYRMIDTGIGACKSGDAAVGTPYGVFFVARNGVYVTTGGEPVKVSDAIQPVFDAHYATDFSLGAVHPDTNFTGITYHKERVWIAFSSSVLVYDPQDQTWLRWSYPLGVRSILGNVPNVVGSGEPMIFIGTASDGVHYSLGAETDDHGTAITTSMTSGWVDFGTDRTKVIRQVELNGTGALTLEVLTDRNYTASTHTVTFPALAANQTSTRQWLRVATRGTQFAYRISGTGWTLDSMILHLRGARAEGEH